MRLKGFKKLFGVIMSVIFVVSMLPSNLSLTKVLAGDDEKTIWTVDQILAATGGDRGLTTCGTGWASNTDSGSFLDGTTLSPNAKAGTAKPKTSNSASAGRVPDNGCYIMYTATENGTLSFYEKTASSSKTFYVVNASGTLVASKTNTGASGSYDIVSAPVIAGNTYYAYMDAATAQIWQVTFAKSVAVTKTPWSEVAAPTINNVSLDDQGNLVVDYTAVIDSNKGAEDVKITMFQNGYEESTQTVMYQSAKATFKSGFSGTYTFKAVAQREGEADKASAVYNYGTYTLSVKAPVITWAQNKGNGSVYLDWLNIEDATDYSVAYKLNSEDDSKYQNATTGLKDASYTLNGLTTGSTYDIKVTANRSGDGKTASDVQTITVSSLEEQPWYVATVGSTQATSAKITDSNGAISNYTISSAGSTSGKDNVKLATSIANTTGTIDIAGQDTGKISDDEDGFSYYYTKINPNTENFKLSAKFTITDVSMGPDGQTGFGVLAADTLGVNYWGNLDYVHKYFNSISSMLFSSNSLYPSFRQVTGYFATDCSNMDGAERTTTNPSFKGSQRDFSVGSSYTFALEKTDAGYVGTCNGQTLSVDDNSFTSVQEDGTVCIGVLASRRVSVKVSNIEFTKSASNGITSSTPSGTKIKPNATVYSTGYCNAKEYTYIYQPNCAGKLSVTGPAGSKLVTDKSVAANEVVRIPVAISEGSNNISAEFTPDASDAITSTAKITNDKTVYCKRYGSEGQTIYVSPDGSSTGVGTKANPLDLATAVRSAQPGQTICLLGGQYTKSVTIERSVCGTATKPITMVPEEGATVTFSGAGLTVVGDYWHIYGLTVKNAPYVGIQICGNNNIVEMCTVSGSGNSGFQISRNGSADNVAGKQYQLWPTNNLVKNCESYDNCDVTRNDADGFAAKLTCGEGNKFYGCISHNNIDDGWDLYAKSITGEIGAVTIENCVAYDNGWLTTDDISSSGYNFGEGNGFKLGGGYLKGGHVLKNCISFNNHGKGITSNSCPDCQIINCISYKNSLQGSTYSVGLNTMDSYTKAWKVSGLISMNVIANTSTADAIPFSLSDASNYFYNGKTSYNNQGKQALDSWFESTDMTQKPTRNADGTINMHGLLVLNSTAPTNSGARLVTSGESATSTYPGITGEVTESIITADSTYSVDNTLSMIKNVGVKSKTTAFKQNFRGNVTVVNAAGDTLSDDAIVGTGCKVKILSTTGQVVSQYEIVIPGDTSGDGELNVLDMEKMQKDILGIEKLTGSNKEAAKLSTSSISENKLSVLDMEIVQKHILGII